MLSQAAVAELQQQLDAERKQRVQLQQQLQTSTAAGALPPVIDAAESAAAADSERQTAGAEEPAGVLLLASISPDHLEGALSPSQNPTSFPADVPHLPLTPFLCLACILVLPFAGGLCSFAGFG